MYLCAPRTSSSIYKAKISKIELGQLHATFLTRDFISTKNPKSAQTNTVTPHLLSLWQHLKIYRDQKIPQRTIHSKFQYDKKLDQKFISKIILVRSIHEKLNI